MQDSFEFKFSEATVPWWPSVLFFTSIFAPRASDALLAKSASYALGAKIAIQNRTDGHQGTVASLNLNSKLSCILPRL